MILISSLFCRLFLTCTVTPYKHHKQNIANTLNKILKGQMQIPGKSIWVKNILSRERSEEE